MSIGISRYARHLCDKPKCLGAARLLVENVFSVWIEGRKGANRAQEDTHRVSVVAESFHKLLDVFVKH